MIEFILQIIAVCFLAAFITCMGGVAFVVVAFAFRSILWMFQWMFSR